MCGFLCVLKWIMTVTTCLSFLSLVDSPIASGVEADSPKNSSCFWVFSDMVIAALENHLYHAILSFRN